MSCFRALMKSALPASSNATGLAGPWLEQSLGKPGLTYRVINSITPRIVRKDSSIGSVQVTYPTKVLDNACLCATVYLLRWTKARALPRRPLGVSLAVPADNPGGLSACPLNAGIFVGQLPPVFG